MNVIENERAIKITYNNHEGVTTIRTIIPRKIWYGSTEWHSEPQWLLEAYDTNKKQSRNFAVRDIKRWH